MVEFYVSYVFDANLACTLSMDDLNVGNVVELRGNVVGHHASTNRWEVKVRVQIFS